MKGRIITLTLFLTVLLGCNQEEETAITATSLSKVSPEDRIIVKNVSFDQAINEITVGGDNFDRVEKVELKNSDGEVIELTINAQSKTSTSFSYKGVTALELISNRIIEIILSTATGAAIVPLTFSVTDGSIVEAKIADGAVATDKIANNSITNEKIKTGEIELSKIHNSGAANGEVVAWSDSENSWVSVPFSILQSSDGAVESITPGVGFKNSGREITSSGTLDLDVGNGKGQIPQFDENDGTLTFVNEIILDSNGLSNSKILFNIDDDNSPEYTIEASGSGLSFIKDSEEKFYINAQGELVIPTLSIGGNYLFPEEDGTENQILATNGLGEVSWTSSSELFTDSLNITATSPVNFDSDTNIISLDEIETGKIKDLTITNADISETANIALSKLATFPLGDRGYVLISSLADGAITNSNVTTDQLSYLEGLTGPIKDTFLHLQDGGTVDGDVVFDGRVKFSNSTQLDGNSTFAVKSGSRINIEEGATLEVNGTLTLTDAIDSASIKNDSVSSLDIKDETLTSDDIKDSSITGDDLAAETITSDKIKDGSITSSDIEDGTILDADIAPNANISADKISASLTSRIFFESGNRTQPCDNYFKGSSITGGGCICSGSGDLIESFPDDRDGSWVCNCSTSVDNSSVICAKWE